LTVALLLVTPSAFGQASSNKVAAEKLFQQGRALLEKHELEVACEKFRASQQLDPAVGTLFSLGDCYEQRSLLASAWLTFQAAAALALQRADFRQSFAQSRAQALEPRLARLHVTLTDPGSVAEVTVDGDPVVLQALETLLPVDPGKHSVEARGERSWSGTVDVPDNGVSAQVTVPSLAAPRPMPRPATWKRPFAIGLLDAGVVTVGIGAIFGMQAIVKGRDVNAECPRSSSTCGNLGAVQGNGTGNTYADVATVTIPVGLAVTALGAVLLATSWTSVEASVGPGSASARMRWVW
jgi:hypothetical protein